MSKKKKVDLSTEYTDFLLDDIKQDVSDAPFTSVLDPDPTIAISKKEQKALMDEAHGKKHSKAIEIDLENSASEIQIEKGIDLKPGKPESENQEAKSKRLKEAEAAAAKMDSTEVKEISEFFSSKTSSNYSPQALPPVPKRVSKEILLSADTSLLQSEQLRIAQERILELESVLEGLRAENEELLAAGETVKNRNDELAGQLERSQQNLKDKHEILNEELIVARASLSAKSDELQRARMKVEELESRLSGDLRRIRVRERELENRLELIKLENQAIIKNKDEMILDLKRKIDQLGFELDNFRSKAKEMNRSLEDHREKTRRTVKALRLALSMLEGDELEGKPLKKVD